MIQICTKCKTPKELSSDNFCKDKQKKTGWFPSCKECNNLRRKAFYVKNKFELNKKNAERQRKNIEQTRDRKLRYSRSAKAKQRHKEYKKTYVRPEPSPEKKKRERQLHSIRNRRYKEKNKNKILEYRKRYKKPPIPLEKRKEYNKRSYLRTMSDTRKKLAVRLRIAVRDGIRNRKIRTNDYIKFTVDELISHLESLWLPGMSWENYGKFGWHIDHIRPCASFDFSNDEEVKKCWEISNLQPLWWHDNASKGSKYNDIIHYHVK